MKKVLGLPQKLIDFFRSVFAELKFIEFPSKKEGFKLTHLVLIASVIMGLSLYGIDTLLNFLRTYLTSLK